MSGFSKACHTSISLAHDGEEPVGWKKLPLPAPDHLMIGKQTFLAINPASIEKLAALAYKDISFLQRSSAIQGLVNLRDSSLSSPRDSLVASELLRNALIAAQGRFPLCQDTGTAAVYAWKGEQCLVEGGLEGPLSRGAHATWTQYRLRNSQVLPQSLYTEKNSGDNSPLALEVFAEEGAELRFLFVAKGGGSSNKTALFQETKAVLRPEAFESFMKKAITKLGVSACPPYRIVAVVGGQSPEETLLAAKLASTGALDAFPISPTPGSPCYRDRETEKLIVGWARESGWGAQFGGRGMARDARVIRLGRHAASLPIAVAVSCVAHRQAYAKVTAEGFFLEELAGPLELARVIDGGQKTDQQESIVSLKLYQGMVPPSEISAGQLVRLSGPVILARDAAHARLATLIEEGEALPSWTTYPVFYASPTETPEGAVIGSIGPTTSKRMDTYLDDFLSRGLFRVMLGKGERAPACREACARHGGLYLAAIGGAAALAASEHVSSSSVIDWPELGMEAIRMVELKDLLALVVTDTRGNDAYAAYQA